MDAVLPADPPDRLGDASDALTTVLAALCAGDAPRVGRFRVDPATDRWWWSDEVYALYGFRPGDVVPTSLLLLAHRSTDDRVRVSDSLVRTARTGQPFGSVHRIVDAAGRARTLAVAAQGRRSRSTGQVVEVSGYVVDVTDSYHEAARQEATASIRAAEASRSVIEQAKGVLMVAFGVGPDEAFALLRRRSNDSNVPVREIARHLVGSLGGGDDVVDAARHRVDALLNDAADATDLCGVDETGQERSG
ncbi:PAS and ANTAR domain-containing protein [Cellulosimicrobium marinum]|uniref:PAS and ANTAR domain-containing protein n=1 Tax=Cellulosimicrobium marinum TaxID=1638992 RepID=UPI001E4D71BF|nr:PAS and ANTAR domain-containing protein [Cellulosimicrobium marinum]MCB7136110.1 PAS and ANTAR domain-containing protein [Cellulosimicrobium marinum]